MGLRNHAMVCMLMCENLSTLLTPVVYGLRKIQKT